MSLSADASQMASLLTALTHPDTNAIRQAEAALKPILKDARCVPAMVEVIKARETQNEAVRHVAVIVLRKRIGGHLSKFDGPTKTALKAELLTILTGESARPVRNGIVALVASICKFEAEAGQDSAAADGGWPELFQFIAAAAADSHPEARELAFLLLGEMTETIGIYLKPQFGTLANLFATALSDADAKVQNASVKALGLLMSYLADEAEVDAFASLTPPVLTVAEACRARNDEEIVSTTLDVLYDLSFSPSPAVGAHMSSIIQFCQICMSDPNLEMGIRDSAALVVATMAESKPKALGRDTALLNGIVEMIFNLIEKSDGSAAGALFESNPAWKEDFNDQEGYDPEGDNEGGPTETSMAQGTLDMLACEIPKKFIFEPVVSRCVARLDSADPNQRKAGIACLGVIAEGCAEPLRENLSQVMPQVFKSAADPDARVRECACFALGQISEHCQPEVLSYASQILPIVFQLLDDTTIAVQATSCYVLEMFCERLEPEGVRPLLDPLVRKLAAMLEATTKRSVQEMAVAALAATAVAAEEEFVPYIAGVAQLMSKLMALKEEKMFTLRGRALECMGHIAVAVGKENFRPYFSATMQCACEGLTFDSTDLHEFAYAAFANLSKVMGDEFSPVLGELVPHLVTVISQNEGQIVEKAEEEEKAGQFNALDDSDDEEEGGNYVMHIRTALLEAKKGAITAIGEMAAHTGSAFIPYIEESMKVIIDATDNWHPLIKAECADALPSFVIPCVAQYHGGEITWEKGDITGSTPLSAETTTVVNTILTELTKLMKDDDKGVVGKACEGIQSVIELCGPHSLASVANDCLEITFSILSKQAPCQEQEDYGDDLGDDDDDHDSFMTSVCDLVGAYGRVMGQHFVQYLPKFLPVICAYAKSSRPASDRSMAIGCLGELAQELGNGIAEHWQTVFYPAVIAGLADPDDSVKRNAAFCAGVSCEGLGETVAPQYQLILQALSPLFSLDISQGDTTAACVDNACAAVARMIMTSPGNIPMTQVIPVVLKALPLKNDMTENETVYNCLLGLLQMNQPDLLANKQDLSRVFAEAVSEGSKVNDELKEKLKLALPSLG